MVEYTLTPSGKELLEPISMLGAWAEKNAEAVQEARQRFDEHTNAFDLMAA
jgi:DNA-binding HxlR family transcriptional regulator